MSKVEVRATWTDGTQNHFTAYDTIEEDMVEEAAGEGYALFSPHPKDDGVSMIIVNIKQVRVLRVTAVPDSGGPQDAAPVDAV